MTFLKYLLICLGLLFLTLPSVILAQSPHRAQVRIIVRLNIPFQPEGRLTRARALEQRANIAASQARLLKQFKTITVNRQYRYVPYLALTVDLDTLRQLTQSTELLSLEADMPELPTAVESVPLIGADQAWAAGYSGAGWTVAILDTGVDSSHDFLAGKVVAEACFSGQEKGQTLCPNGQTSQIGTGAGINCPLTINGCEHGTHVAGIAAGNGAGQFGVAKEASLISIQLFSRFDQQTDCTNKPAPCIQTLPSDQIAALEQVYTLCHQFNIAAVNMSLGGGQFTEPCDNDSRAAMVETLRSVNIAVIASAGNDGYSNALTRPACISQVVSVGATYITDTVVSFSNSANFLDFLAPGFQIISSLPGNTFAPLSGTSMASPHVAGAWAILKSKFPTATIDEIYSTLANTGMAVTDSRNSLTKPRIQIDAALLPNIALTQQVNTVNPSPKQPLTYTIRLKNSGLTTLNNILLTALWPTDLVITRNILVSQTTLMKGQVLTLTLPTTIAATIPAHTRLTNSLTVTAVELPHLITKTFSVMVAAYPAVTMSKVANVSQAVVGQIITFTYQVTNTGNTTLTRLFLTDSYTKLGYINLNTVELAMGQTVSQIVPYTVTLFDLTGRLTRDITLQAYSADDIFVFETAPSAPLRIIRPTTYLPLLLKENYPFEVARERGRK